MQSQTDTINNSTNDTLANNQATTSSNVTPISTPVVPPPHKGPSKLFYIILGLTLFVFLGLIFAIYVAIKANNTLRLRGVDDGQSEQITVGSVISPTNSLDETTEELLVQSSSDEVDEIENDLNKTELNTLDEESSSIDVILSE